MDIIKVVTAGCIILFLLSKIDVKIKIEPKVWGIKYLIDISLEDIKNFVVNIGIKIIRLISIKTHIENHEREFKAIIVDNSKNII